MYRLWTQKNFTKPKGPPPSLGYRNTDGEELSLPRLVSILSSRQQDSQTILIMHDRMGDQERLEKLGVNLYVFN